MQREPLPNRRFGFTQKIRVGGQSVFIRTGEYDDGRLGEIFIDMYRSGSSFKALLNALAISVSIGLQSGIPLERYIRMYKMTRFEPAGTVSGYDRFSETSSVLDAVFRILEDYYVLGIKSKTRSSVQEPVIEQEPVDIPQPVDTVAVARMKGYTGDVCSHCGSSMMVRNGTCLKCESCGETTGCS